jgi:photosystem II stability/assembly factor-like uncharacterized protein
MRYLGALLAVVVLVGNSNGCSDRASSPDSGPVWPDTFVDLVSAADQSAPDRGVDSAGDPDADAGADADGSLPLVWTVAQVGTEDLHDVACVQGQVFAVGDGGTVLHRGWSAPPGAVFDKQVIATAADLYTVTFADLTYGAVAGKDPQIWDTKDQGTTWAVAPQCSAFVFDTFYALHLDSATTGFGAGVTVNSAGAGNKYFTGYSWVCGASTYPGETFYDVHRLGSSGWIVGDTGGKIYRTEDALTWSTVSAGVSETLRGVTFSGASLGLVAGDKGTILRSTDGQGSTWTPVSSGVTEDLWDITLFDGSNGWAVGEGGTLLRTADGGLSWTPEQSGTSVRLEAICFTSSQEGWAVGQAGTVLVATPGGI